MSTYKLILQSQQLIERLENMEAFISVAKSHAKDMIKVCQEAYVDVDKLSWTVSAHELPRLADLANQSATRFDYELDNLIDKP